MIMLQKNVITLLAILGLWGVLYNGKMRVITPAHGEEIDTIENREYGDANGNESGNDVAHEQERIKDSHVGEKEETGYQKESEKDKQKQFSYSINVGFKGYYSLGISPENMTYQPYGMVTLEHTFFRISAGYSRFIDYQITDGFQTYREINFHRPEVSLSIYPFSFMEIYGDYQYSSWFDHYRSSYYHAGLVGIFNDFMIEIVYNYTWTLYSFNTFAKAAYTLSLYDTEIKKDNPGISLSYFVNKKAGIDLTFDYYVERYSYYNDTYRRYITSLSAYYEVFKFLSLSLDFGIGTDSINFFILSPDIGCIIKPVNGLQLNINYGIEHNIGASLSRMERMNRFIMVRYPNYSYIVVHVDPKLRLVTIGRDFSAYKVSFGVSCRY